MKCVAIDFETANNDPWSACAVGIALRKGGEIVSGEWLIKPPAGTFFEPKYHVAIHGITPEMVENCPTFPQVWQEIEDFIGEPYLFVAHNAPSAERRILNGLFDYYKMGPFLTPILCTLEISKGIIPDNFLKSRKLPHLVEFLELEFGTHHDARSDAIGCLKLVETLSNNHFITETLQKYHDQQDSVLSHFCRVLQNNLASEPPQEKQSLEEPWKNQSSSKRRKLRPVEDFDDVQFGLDNVDEFFESLVPDGRFEGKMFAMTGDLEFGDEILIPKKCILDVISAFGGNVTSTMTYGTDYLIVGNYKQTPLWNALQQWLQTDQPSQKRSFYHLLTGKIRKAMEILENNPAHNLQIINSEMFLKMLK